MHSNSFSNIYPTRCNLTQFILSGNCICIWYLSHRYCCLSLSRKSWNCRAAAVDTVVCAPDNGWMYHPKYVEQFPGKINCVTLHLVGYILKPLLCFPGARGGAVGWGTALQAGRSRVRFIGFLHWHNPSGRTMALGSTQPLTEISTRNVSWG